MGPECILLANARTTDSGFDPVSGAMLFEPPHDVRLGQPFVTVLNAEFAWFQEV